MGDCNCPDITLCLCSVEDTDCFSIDGKGHPDSPFYIDADLEDRDEGNGLQGNLLECNPSGLGTFLPNLIADPPRAKIQRTVNFPVQTSTRQTLAWDPRPRYDSAGMYDFAVSDYQLNIVEDGLYIVHCTLGWEEPVGSAFASFSVARMPADYNIITDARYITPALGTPTPRTSISGESIMETGDWLEVRVFQNTGDDPDTPIEEFLNVVGAIMSARWVAKIP